MIDTHTHLNFQAFKDDWQEVVERSVKAGLKAMVVVGTDVPSSSRAVDLAEQHGSLYASVGIHPHHARKFLISNSKFLNKFQIPNPKFQNSISQLEKLAHHPKVIAIGEVGLDYHVYRNTKYPSTLLRVSKELKNLQKQLLGMQVQLAKELNKAMIIHSREAGEEALGVMEHFCKNDGQLPKGVWHCFDGSKKYLAKVIEAGFYVSFTGNITYVPDRATVAREVPLEKLLLETDCPFMPPRHALRGNAQTAYSAVSQAGSSGGQAFEKTKKRRSEPSDVKVIAEFHARDRGIKFDEVTKETTGNAERLFGV